MMPLYIRVGTFFGARERKDKIVGTIAEPRTKRRTSYILIPLHYDPKTPGG
jgi:hypothetical protein